MDLAAPQAIIGQFFPSAEFDGPPPEVPEELAEWCCHLPDAGHCVVVSRHPLDRPPTPSTLHASLVAAAVPLVLEAGWDLEYGIPVCRDLPDADTGEGGAPAGDG